MLIKTCVGMCSQTGPIISYLEVPDPIGNLIMVIKALEVQRMNEPKQKQK